MEPITTIEYIKHISYEFIYVAVAAIGGLARYLQKYLEDGKFSFSHLFAHLIVSAFSGYMFGEFGLWLGLGDSSLFLLVGMGGYMGTESLKLVETFLTKYSKNNLRIK
jgi:hypothetical protein